MSAEPALPHRTAGSALRIVAAVALVVGGLVHLQLYFDGYRDVPNANLGRSFLLNGFGSAAIALALVARREAVVRLAAVAMVVGTLVAFTLSRTDRGVFGFTESGFEPSPQAALALISEVVALVALALTFAPAVGAGRSVPIRIAGPAGAALAIATAVLCIAWDEGERTPAAAAPDARADSVAIAGFAFTPARLTVPVGATVTWTNGDRFAHSVDAADDSFVSEPLDQGTSFSHTFDAAGTFAYICGIHPSMAGTVVVTE
ncbi:MAG: cupredoxin family copper-binding protein [Ilumatobacteraceae bacterium]